MKRDSVLDHQSVKRKGQGNSLRVKRTCGQLGFGLIKMFLFLLALGGLSLALISGYQLISSSSYLRIRSILVRGANDALKEELLGISGITERESLLSLDTAAIEANIAEHSWIKSVSVWKEFPSTLHIQVQKEEPIALVLLDRMYLMDTEGVLFKYVEDDDQIDFPIITGLSGGDTIHSAHLERAASFLRTYSSMNAALPAQKLSEVHVEKDGSLSVYLSTLPFKVAFGRNDFARKIGSLKDIVTHLKITDRLYQARLIDLDYRDRGVVAFTEKVVHRGIMGREM
jgi:cell division protein FtsQ